MNPLGTMENGTQNESGPKRKLLGKPSYMSGVGVERAFNAISGGGHNMPVDDLPLDDLPLEEAGPQPNIRESEAPPAKKETAGASVSNENQPIGTPVLDYASEAEVKPSEPTGSKNSTPTRNKTSRTDGSGASSKTSTPASKPKGEREMEKAGEAETMHYNVRIVLSSEELLQLETFCFQLRMKVIHRFKRKPAVGIQTLSQFIIKKLLKDQKFAQAVEEELSTYFGDNHE